MAINRGPFNALIDDDGSNTIGTPWNKAAIQGVILDPVDAAIGAAVTLPWTAVPFNAANFSARAPLTWTVGPAAVIRNRYTLSGKILFWSVYISWFSGGNVLGGAPGPVLNLTLPGGLVGQDQTVAITYCAGVGGVAPLGGLKGGPNGAVLEVTRGDGGNFALTDVPGLIFGIWIEVP
jgi:hypothetical protein